MNDVPLLDARDLHVRLGRREVLRGASVALTAGEIVALLGPNGSGKTTLLRAAMGFVRRSSGDVGWQGDRTLVDRPASLARVAAYLPQQPTTPALARVGETIGLGRFAAGDRAYADDAASRAAIERAAALTGVADLLDARVAELSGGQRQRVFLARALCQSTPALVLDEPASFLDVRHQIDVCRLLRDAADRQGTGVLMTSHDINLAAEYADRVAVMNDGLIIADGPPDEVLTPTLVGDVFGVTVKRVDIDGKPRLIAIG